MPNDPKLELDAIAEAVSNRRIAAEDIATLRGHIQTVADARTEALFVRAALRSLKVAGTQLKAIEPRALPAFDDAAFEALQPHVRKRILLRLNNLTKRMTKASAVATRLGEAPLAADADPAFRCMRDYEAARSRKGASVFWCQLSLVVCLLRSVLGLLAQRASK